MQNLPICLRSAGVLFVFGIVYHPKKNNRLERLKMENKQSLPISQPKATYPFAISLMKRKHKVKNATKIKKIFVKTAKSCVN